MKLLLVSFLLACVNVGVGLSQGSGGFSPTICKVEDAAMELKCLDACIICDIDGFSGRNDNGGQIDEGDKPLNFCTGVNHNIQWIGFLATDSRLTLSLTVQSCEDGDAPGTGSGLEAGIYKVDNCDYDNAVLMTSDEQCHSFIADGAKVLFNMDDLIAGDYYYFVIDGNGGGICDYTIQVEEGSTKIPELGFSETPITGPRQVCPGSTHDYTGERVVGAPGGKWSLDGVNLQGSIPRQQIVTFPNVDYGIAELCYTVGNVCSSTQTCIDVVIGDPGTQEDRPICAGASTNIDGVDIGEVGDYPVTYQNLAGCDSTVIYTVLIGEAPTVLVPITYCAGGCTEFDGITFCADLDTIVNRPTPEGCDSYIRYVAAEGPPPTVQVDVPFCAGGCTRVADIDFCEEGETTVVYKTEAGCDSIVRYVATEGPPPIVQVDVRFCAGGCTTEAGIEFCEARDTIVTYTSTSGCDSLVRYVATEGAPPAVRVEVPFCAGGCTMMKGIEFCDLRDTTVTYRTRLGCDSLVQYVGVEGPPPTVEVPIALCEGVPRTVEGIVFSEAGRTDTTYITASGCDSNVVYVVTVSPTIVMDPQRELMCARDSFFFSGNWYSEPDTYSVVFASAAGCDSTVTLVLEVEDCGFSGSAKGSALDCNGDDDGVITVSIAGKAPPYLVAWGRRGSQAIAKLRYDTEAFDLNLAGLNSGDYEINVRDVFGQVEVFSAEVTEPEPIVLALDAVTADGGSRTESSFDLACHGDQTGKIDVTPDGGTSPYTYAWDDGATTAVRDGLGAGSYGLTITDAAGCEVEGDVTLFEPPALTTAVETFDRDCDITRPGGVVSTLLDGGVAPYTYQIDTGAILSADGGFDVDLDPGTYMLRVFDDYGCSTSQELAIAALEPVVVEAGDPVRIYRGETAGIDAYTPGEGVDFSWRGAGVIDCPSCSSTQVQPDSTTLYNVTAINADGCRATASQLVIVEIDRGLWAPTAFSPDGDALNDGFTIFASDDASIIEELRVFDRWGESVFAGRELPAGSPEAGWNGSFRGEPSHTGVYVYYAVVRASDGETFMIEGDVTLMR